MHSDPRPITDDEGEARELTAEDFARARRWRPGDPTANPEAKPASERLRDLGKRLRAQAEDLTAEADRLAAEADRLDAEADLLARKEAS
ncbi:MAG: hypothetical protein AAGI70_03010 [Pseudomonadota bacterium]